MSLEINPECVGCGQKKCSNCEVEKVPLYRKPPKIKRGMNDEAPRGDRHGSKMLHGCKPPRAAIINRAAPLQLSPTEGTLASNPELASVIRSGECTPRSNQEDNEDIFELTTFDVVPDTDGDTNFFFDPVLFPDSEGHASAFIWPQYESENVIEAFDPNGIDLLEGLNSDLALDPSLDPASNPTNSLEPQIPASIFPPDINTINPAHFHNAFPFPAPWTGHIIQSPELHMSSFPYEQPLDLPIERFSNPTRQFSDMESLLDQQEELPHPQSPLRRNSDDCQPSIDKRKFYQEGREDRPVHKAFRACESCSSIASSDENRSLACLFYKRDPARYASCIKKKFENISALRQHLDNEHKLGVYHCKSCWNSFADQKSLDAHAACEPTYGSSVDQLPPIPKARGPNPNATFNNKWYWTWKKLFGERTALPDCPYSHPTRDMAGYLFSKLLQDLTTQGTKLDIHGFEEAISQWLASYQEPSNEYPVMEISVVPNAAQKP
ncbi:hypothetical protein F4815DRAFT_464904 [Daldinia loculata]|nr:hypothetical protein F4815DRAFT_464904 [Daldinia loculata]